MNKRVGSTRSVYTPLEFVKNPPSDFNEFLLRIIDEIAIELSIVYKYTKLDYMKDYKNGIDDLRRLSMPRVYNILFNDAYVVIECIKLDKYKISRTVENDINTAIVLQLLHHIASTIKDKYENLLLLYMGLFQHLITYSGSFVALLGKQQLYRYHNPNDSYSLKETIDVILGLNIRVTIATVKLLKYWLLKVLILVDTDDVKINTLFKKLTYGFKIDELTLRYIVSGCNNISIDIASGAIYSVLSHQTYKISDLYALRVVEDIAKYYKYFITTTKLFAIYGYNVLHSDCIFVYSKLWGYYSIIAINDFIQGNNRHAYKIYKLLCKIPTDTLLPHHAAFVSIINHHLYAPGGQGALHAAEEFTNLVAGDI
jgi:hypothetical protein